MLTDLVEPLHAISLGTCEIMHDVFGPVIQVASYKEKRGFWLV